MANKLNIKPLGDNVLIRPTDAEEKTASGILLPDNAREKPQMGEVMAIGEGVIDDGLVVKGSMLVKVGQTVMYKKWGGDEIKVNSETWMMVKQSDILAVME